MAKDLATWRPLRSPHLAVIALFGLALGVRLLFARAVVFPPLDDPAYYVKVAENLAAGRGLQIDVIWNFNPVFPAISHPSNEFWMPLPSLVMWPFLALFGDNLWAAQIPGLLAGALLAPLAFLAGRLLFHEAAGPYVASILALGAAVLVALNPVLAYQSATMDSSALFALLSIVAIFLLALPGRGNRRFLLSGLACGLAYLATSSGLFLILAVLGWLLGQAALLRFRKGVAVRVAPLGLALLGMGIVVAPWLVRNYLIFGFLTSPAGLQSVFATDYAYLFSVSPVSASWGDILRVRGEALWVGFRQVLDFVFFPTAIPAIAGSVLLAWWAPRFRLPLFYFFALYLGLSLIFSVPAINGTFYHAVGGAVPFITIGLVYLIWRLAGLFASMFRPVPSMVGLYSVVLLLSVFTLLGTLPQVTARHAQEKEMFGRAQAWLEEHQAKAVMTTQPATLNYASGIPSVMLPVNDSPEVAWQLARDYGVNYLLVTQEFGQYPEALAAVEGKLFRRVYDDGNFIIYRGLLPGSE
ncbi:MAG: glycosyltransferase family 39 protein [Chloroflexi bacterium]|nr:glycosyltransferase family 39 protein [Chloroflexota bacterium]